MVGNSLWILVTLVVLGIAYVCARRDKESVVRLAGLAFCTLGAFAVPTISRCKHGFYGLSFFLLVTFGAVLALREIFTRDPPRRYVRWITVTVLVCAALIGAWHEPRSAMWGTRGDPRRASSRLTCNDIVAALVAHRPGENPLVLITAQCQYPNCHTLEWLSRQQGHKFSFTGVRLDSTLEEYRRAAENADLVLAYKTDHPITQFGCERQASAVLAMMRSLPGFVEVSSFPSYDGLVYYLFKNTHTAFIGWKSCAGLGPVEGPFPKWGLPRVRWGFGRQTQLRFDSDGEAPMHLVISCRAGAPDQVLSVFVDGQRIHQQRLPPATAFTPLDLSLPPMPPGEHELTLRYAASETATADSRS